MAMASLIFGMVGLLLTLIFPFFLAFYIRGQGQAPKGLFGASLLTIFCYLILVAATIGALASTVHSACGGPQAREPIANLQALFVSQAAYAGEHDAYAGGESVFNLLYFKPQGQGFYSYFCGDTVIPNKKGPALSLRPGGDWPLEVKPGSSSEYFTCMALGNMDDDQTYDVWMINNHDELKNLVNDGTDQQSNEIYAAQPCSTKFLDQLAARRIFLRGLSMPLLGLSFLLLIACAYRDHQRLKPGPAGL